MVICLYVKMQEGTNRADVTVIGSGLAGMAASFHLARAGYHVTCIEPDMGSKQPVGESLDWSAPALLQELGLSTDGAIRDKIDRKSVV